jgi:hypothetical protein
MGVGAGRTTALRLPISGDCADIDDTQEMVQACRARPDEAPDLPECPLL